MHRGSFWWVWCRGGGGGWRCKVHGGASAGGGGGGWHPRGVQGTQTWQFVVCRQCLPQLDTVGMLQTRDDNIWEEGQRPPSSKKRSANVVVVYLSLE